MVRSKRKTYIIINICLVLIAIVLLLNFLEVRLPTFGKTLYMLDRGDALCVVHNADDELWLWDDLDRCCLEARSQAICLKEVRMFGQERLSWVCPAGLNLEYLLNSKAYNYCQQLSFW